MYVCVGMSPRPKQPHLPAARACGRRRLLSSGGREVSRSSGKPQIISPRSFFPVTLP